MEFSMRLDPFHQATWSAAMPEKQVGTEKRPNLLSNYDKPSNN
jgi:hypothetical protein